MKKRSREEYENGASSGNQGGDPKRFRLNHNCHADHPGHGSGSTCNSAKYHRNCKHPTPLNEVNPAVVNFDGNKSTLN